MDTLLPARALSAESSFGGAADTFSNVASLSSTPPTTVADSISLASEASKHEITSLSDPIEEPVDDSAHIAAPEPLDQDHAVDAIEPSPDAPEPSTTTSTPADTPRRTRPHRTSMPVYNLAKLSGTAIHGKRAANGDIITTRRRRTISGDTLVGNAESGSAKVQSTKTGSSKKRARSPEPPQRATRSSGVEVENLARKISSLGKKGKKTFEKGAAKLSRELKRIIDTNEYAGIDTKPVLYTTWAKGKLVTESSGPARKKAKLSESPKKTAASKPEKVEPAPPSAPAFSQRRVKKWLDHGLYSGQDAPVDVTKHLTPGEKKTLADLPELTPSGNLNKALPSPIFNGLRLLLKGRDFKLPFDVCSPLPPGQPKPEEWRKMTRNRFIGHAAAYWKKTPHFKDYQSKCVCTAEDGCAESCQNRIMLYECDSNNCNAGAAHCTNRAFAKLQERHKAGGKYRVGVDVIKTDDRGYGIRSNRTFEPNQIIMEYTGEIITEEECDRRMREKYKDNKCYYLMSFDQNMIIDATTGSPARFVNHSCQPNCRMIKWIVSGQPRMALFAGDRPIMTGEELTYDYNFDPFSAKNVQVCLCGSPNCRGVLGPKPKEVKPPKAPKEDLKKTVKKGVSAGKRKLKEFISDGDDAGGNAIKKRKIKTPTGVKAKGIKRSLSNASLKAARGAANVVKMSVKKSASSISVAKTAFASKTAGRKIATVKRTSTIKTYSKTVTSKTPKKTASRNSSMTIVAAGLGSASGKRKTPSSSKSALSKVDKSTPSRPVGRPRKHPLAEDSPRQGLELSRSANQIRVVQSPAVEAA